MTAFVPAAAATGVFSRRSSFTDSSRLETAPVFRHAPANVRMAGLTDKERKSFAKVGGTSKWRENLFTGGFPGGEEAFLKWSESGMGDEVPDLPDFLQPTKEFKKSADSRAIPTVLERVTSTEYFKDFIGGKPASPEVVEGDEPELVAAEAATPEPVVSDDPPVDNAVVNKYYPASVRNLAPMIDITYEKDFYKDRVSMSMGEVTASASDLYFPKEYSGMAPMIDISYNGNLATASVSVSMAAVDALPSIAPPVATGETVTKLTPGAGGGLKLDFEVQGSGPVNVYSDPRCIDKFNAMVAGES